MTPPLRNPKYAHDTRITPKSNDDFVRFWCHRKPVHLGPPRYIRCSGSVAVVLRGGRGSQPLDGPAPGGAWRVWRSSSGAAVDRNPAVAPYWSDATRGGGRPPGRPWIATHISVKEAARYPGVAVVLRGGRGSQPPTRTRRQQRSREWRSSSGAAVDRNDVAAGREVDADAVAVVLRGGRGSQLTHASDVKQGHPSGGRPPGRPWIATGFSWSLSWTLTRVAVVLRGGRGSQLNNPVVPSSDHVVAVVLRGGRGSQP
ncbi:hypothetical protein DC74_6142 [Streptomyces noursei]|nr:hypothetical protein DC74_6142 [Streptomyces noursei]